MKMIIHIFWLVGLVIFIGSTQAQDLSNINQQKPFKLDGSVELRGMFYQANGIADRMDPFNYILSGSPTFSIYGWTVPTSFTFSKNERNFQQPFNQYGISPTYKWITMHGGYRNVSFSPYTLAGHTMLGGGLELNPGKIRFGAMHGRLNRASIIDTASMSLVPYSFTRKGTAIKVGYGSASNYFDLNFLHAKDDSLSRPGQFIASLNQVAPASNSVLAYGTRFTLFKKLFLESDGAVSIYTNDLNSTITLDSIPDAILRKLGSMLDINGSSEWFLAFSAGIGYNFKNFGLRTTYKRIEPGFKSMGSYFFNNDVENITIAPSYNHPSGKFNFQGSFGVEQDNVNLQKISTSKRIIGSANISSNISERLGVDLIFNNYSNNQRPNTLRLADSLRIVQTTQTFGVMPRYTIISTEKVQAIFLSANFNSMRDFNSYFEANAESRNVNTYQYLLNYNLGFPQKSLSINTGINYTKLNSAHLTNEYKGASVGGQYLLANKKLSVGSNLSYMLGESNKVKSNIFTGSANLGYSINKLQAIRAMVYFTNNNPGSAVLNNNPSFTETRGEIAYQFNFGL